ncbi:IclR family transcriptional regulator domain-containing protein [Brucella anthropi]|uniref:IclR family transcriptional regulator domain-containing protein n=1 Tax=Brucella anthropi TaxID=529 RepID=UPI00124C1995|nr:IclR family transcriptional regulator C-terminal domain-containing protein [Brucella anthropi]KAB2730833.1 hypothetical protein F9K89_24100 [Brucella anthropi]
MIAFLDKRDQDLHLKASLPKITGKTVTTRRQLDQELAKVRRFGYAIDQEENEIGCVCYAAPIFGSHGQPIAAISVSVPTERLNDILDLHLPEKVKASAGRISESIISSGIAAEFAKNLKSRRGTGKKNTRQCHD